MSSSLVAAWIFSLLPSPVICDNQNLNGVPNCSPQDDSSTALTGYATSRGTMIPHQASQNYSVNDSSTFSVTRAQQLDNALKSSASPESINSQGGAQDATVDTSNNSNNKGRSEAGAIAGGVVGGLAFLVVLVFLVLRFLRYRRRKAAASRVRPVIDDDTAFSAPTPFITDLSSPPTGLYLGSDPKPKSGIPLPFIVALSLPESLDSSLHWGTGSLNHRS
ncbi:hypothetical protein GYMLUDRAFT_235886 [Collybiopsis luxurians FD-317 M1]|nr:hypothetical protein GYMLUDRAFT_235886 [Collybiopsis luxurians FD-317 M1]